MSARHDGTGPVRCGSVEAEVRRGASIALKIVQIFGRTSAFALVLTTVLIRLRCEPLIRILVAKEGLHAGKPLIASSLSISDEFANGFLYCLNL